MRTFKDNQNQQWTLSLTLGTVRRLRDATGIDLFNPDDHWRLLTSVLDRVEWVYLLVADQRKKYEIDRDEFDDRLVGEGFMDAAGDALMEEMVDFFHQFGQQAMAKLTEKQLKVMQHNRAVVKQQIESGDFDKALDQAEALTGAVVGEKQSSDGSGSQS